MSSQSTLLSAQLYPGRALGFFVLGASLHDVLTRVKSEPSRYPKIEVYFTSAQPVTSNIKIGLPANGLRLSFDGPEQRLRLVEVLDFSKSHIFYKPPNEKERDLVRHPQGQNSAAQNSSESSAAASTQHPQDKQHAGGTAAKLATASASGPTFRHIYQRFLGPTYDGEFVQDRSDPSQGTYILSYPGVSFTFPMRVADFSPHKDVVAQISSSAVPQAMAVFAGDSWSQACKTLFTAVLPSLKTFQPCVKGKEVWPDEVSLITLHGGGRLRLFRKWSDKYQWIVLGSTTPQELLATLGPPDAVYRKSGNKMGIHKNLRAPSQAHSEKPIVGQPVNKKPVFDLDAEASDTDASLGSVRGGHLSDGTNGSDEAAVVDDDDDDEDEEIISEDCFWNYFYLGFDILMSTPSTQLSSASFIGPDGAETVQHNSVPADRLVATKVLIHGNIPGSYPFNRHRRCRWEIAYLEHLGLGPTNSETPWPEIEKRMKEHWKNEYASEEDARQKQRGMVLGRDWGTSPGSSVELPEAQGEDSRGKAGAGTKKLATTSTTTIYGYPGMVFEVLKNGYVSCLTVHG